MGDPPRGVPPAELCVGGIHATLALDLWFPRNTMLAPDEEPLPCLDILHQ